MLHTIPDDVPNSAVMNCINEYVRRERDRSILQDHWFGGLSMMAIADKYDVSADDSIARANYRIKNSTAEAFRKTVNGYNTVTTVTSTINLTRGSTKYALLPVWILNTSWKGQKFTFAVNGQTGKIAGRLPMDKGAFWSWFAGVTAIASAVTFAVLWLAH